MELQPAQPFTHTPVHPAQGEGKTINKVIIGISHNVLSPLALSLLKDREHLPSPELRARLLESLDLAVHLDATSIPVEEGELVGWLIECNIVADDPATFTALAASDTDGRAFAISKSDKFATFMSTSEITPAQVGLLVGKPIVPTSIRDEIVDRFDEFTAGSSTAGLSLVASYALGRGKTLAWAEIGRLASTGVSADIVTRLMVPYLGTATFPHLAAILALLGGKYVQLAVANGRHPRVPVSDANWTLVRRLQALGLVKTASQVGGDIKVNMRNIK